MNTVNPSQSKPNTAPRRWIRRLGLGCLSILLGLPLLYYGYCWGVWGRSSLLLQYLFQCKCPPASEEARYSRQVDVIVSACENITTSRLSPGGRFLYMYEEDAGQVSAYLLNLQSNEKITIATPKGPFYFVTDNLLYVLRGDEYIFDWMSGKQYPIQKFVYSRPDAQINGDADLVLLAQSLREAEHIFLISATHTVIALTSDFYTYPERNFVADRFDIPGSNIERFLRENNIVYQTILPDFPHEVISPDGKFIARDDGIYLVETDRRIVKASSSLVRGWTSDGRGVIYSTSYGRCLLWISLPFMDSESRCEIWVPQPVLLLKIPDQYLSPAGSP